MVDEILPEAKEIAALESFADYDDYFETKDNSYGCHR